MQTELAESGGLWLPITELAAQRGLSKSTVSERVAKLEGQGLIQTRPAPKGRGKLVHVASFLKATNATGDAAKEMAAATRAAIAAEEADEPPAATEAPRDPTYRDAQARAKQLEADLRELDLAERRRELVAVAELAATIERAAETIVAVIERLPQRAEDMAAAVGRDGVPGARAQYKRDARELRSQIADALTKTLALAPAAHAGPVIADNSVPPLWGDLDPNEFATERSAA